MSIVEKIDFFPDIVEEFFEELDFLWLQRESVVFDPDWTLEDLAALEARAEAHLDGLRLAGDDGVTFARSFLRGDQTGAATAATFVLMEAHRPDLDAEVLLALDQAELPAKAGIAIGLRHTDATRISESLRRVALGGDPATRAFALDVLAFHRLGPPPSNTHELFSSPDPEVRARVYAAAGRFGGPWNATELEFAFDGTNPHVRWAAVHAAARLGLAGLTGILREISARVDMPVPEAVEFLGALGERRDLQLFQNLLHRAPTRVAALKALGAAGWIESIPSLLDAMTDPSTRVAAGKAFARITGARGIEATEPAPEGLAPADLEFYVGEKSVMPEKASAWWEEQKGRFDAGSRWQAGFIIGSPPTADGFDELPLDVRRDLAFAALVTHPSKAIPLELEARVARQRHGSTR